jgi:hypothetical protein
MRLGDSPNYRADDRYFWLDRSGTVGITVSTDQTSYTRNQSVSITRHGAFRGRARCNAAVNFTVKKSNGALMMRTATTRSNGTALYKLWLTKKDPVGNYEADATVMSASAATNFMV